MIAAYLLQEREPNPIQVGDGALVGLMAGVIGAFVYLVLSIPITLLMAPMQSAVTERIVNDGNFPPEVREMLSLRHRNRPRHRHRLLRVSGRPAWSFRRSAASSAP